jgi:UDP-N-acetyl-D-mannosaminuronic acid dehydrogenase
MTSVVREHFARYGLVEGRDLLLGNSPNRVMPGRLVERVAASDKVVAGLRATTAARIRRLYSHIVTKGTLHPTNSMTAEVVKTLENAYRDVRIALSTELVRWCDEHDIDFYQLRDRVNARLAQEDSASSDPNAVPSGGLLVPTVGVGGHCLPKDGILLWWRAIEAGEDTSRSLILAARHVNDESPAATVALAERQFGSLAGRSVALLGVAYRFNSEDTRNSPTLVLAKQLLARGATVSMHDPYVKPDDQNLLRLGLEGHFTRDLDAALAGAEIVIFCTAHHDYMSLPTSVLPSLTGLAGIVDGCNLYQRSEIESRLPYVGIGRGTGTPDAALEDFAYASFRAMERGVANELVTLIGFLNERYADGAFNRVEFTEVQRIAGTCVTGCAIADPGPIAPAVPYRGFTPRLVQVATG